MTTLETNARIPDISKCIGTDCNRKESCLRYTKTAKVKWQSWIIMQVSVPDVEKCKWYLKDYAELSN